MSNKKFLVVVQVVRKIVVSGKLARIFRLHGVP